MVVATDIIYEGVGETFEDAVEKAHRQIPPRAGRDFAISRVVEWGMQIGGIAQEKLFYVRVLEDKTGSYKTQT